MEDTAKSMGKVIRIDESETRSHLDEVVGGRVEETLNAMLDAEADEIGHAQRYEHSPDRVDTRAGSYRRKLHTKAREVEVKVPGCLSTPSKPPSLSVENTRTDKQGRALVPVEFRSLKHSLGFCIRVRLLPFFTTTFLSRFTLAKKCFQLGSQLNTPTI